MKQKIKIALIIIFSLAIIYLGYRIIKREFFEPPPQGSETLSPAFETIPFIVLKEFVVC